MTDEPLGINVESLLALRRLTEHRDQIVSRLAAIVLQLVEALRDAEHRALVAEAKYEAAVYPPANVRAAPEG